MKALKAIVILEAVLLLGAVLFVGGAAAGLLLPQYNPDAGTAVRGWMTAALPDSWQPAPTQPEVAAPATDLETLFRPFWQAWQIAHDEFVDQPLDDRSLLQGAIRGMMQALGDEQSSYMDPDQYDQANIPLEGEYEGIGAWVDTDGPYLTIISAMEGSPAQEAGLRPGDQVVAVDGNDMTGVSPQLVIRRVMGPEGTTVVLTIHRPDPEATFDVEVTRRRISVPSVESKTLDGDIGYIRLSSFASESVTELRQAIRRLQADGATGLILDLRGNGGGYLTTAVDVSSEFIADGVILSERFGDGREQTYRASGDGTALDLPLVVLIDGGSASASEIVAGAVQDQRRGWLVGQPSFGKGSVQNWHPLRDDAGAVRVTIARWYTPSGRSIDGQGLVPDISVEITEADQAAGLDPQLDRAVELLRQPPAESAALGFLQTATATP